MPLTVEARDTVFRALLPVFKTYAKRWKTSLSYATKSALGYYSIDVKGPGSPTFATLFAHLNDVRVYVYPLRVWKDLSASLPASVKKRIVSGNVFVFKDAVTAVDRSALTKLLAAAAKRVDERMKLAPKVPYTKKLSAKDQAASKSRTSSKVRAANKRGRKSAA